MEDEGRQGTLLLRLWGRVRVSSELHGVLLLLLCLGLVMGGAGMYKGRVRGCHRILVLHAGVVLVREVCGLLILWRRAGG